MKTLACKDMGVECPFVAQADTDEEVINLARAHSMAEHADIVAERMKTMTPDQMLAAMTAQIKTA